MIPVSLPMITDADMIAVRDVLASNWLTTGPRVTEFEHALEARLHTGCCVVSSATAGLHLALLANGVERGDKVIVPTWTFTATAEAVEMAGAIPVFADIDPITLNLTPEITRETDLDQSEGCLAVIPVHMAGRACDVRGIWQAIDGGQVIEDAAHAFGACYDNGEPVGSNSIATTVFSFYATKGITTLGEGGMVATSSDHVAKLVRRMRFHGLDREVYTRNITGHAGFEVVSPGFKYNMSDAQAAMGRSQLLAEREWFARRQQIARGYAMQLGALPISLPEWTPGHSWHLYQIKLPRPEAPKFIAHMRNRGVACGVHYLPLHRNRYWAEKYGLKPTDFPGAESVYNRVVSLPMWAGLTPADQMKVCDAVHQYFD